MGIFSTSQIFELLKEIKPHISENFIEEIMQHFLQQGTSYSYEKLPRVTIKRGICWDPNKQYSTRHNSKVYKEIYSKKKGNYILDKSAV